MLLSLYLRFFLSVYALYLFFNRGVAYSFLAEINLVVGLLLAIRYRRQWSWVWDRSMILLFVLLGMNLLYVVRGIFSYPFFEVLRDSFMLQYAYFILVVALLRPMHPQLMRGLARVYFIFPWVVVSTLLLRSFIPELNEWVLFGEAPLLVYKNGDLAVHLLVATFFLIERRPNVPDRWAIAQAIVLFYLLFITATFNRGGMVAYVAGASCYLWYLRRDAASAFLFRTLRALPLLLMLVVPIYMFTKIEDKTQGRNTGLSQLKENVISIVSRESDDQLNSNVLWRLAWWGKIIDYTFAGPYFLQGKGLGINLAVDDDIPFEDDALRSPHNFHLNILARYGVPMALLWLVWLFLIFRSLRVPDLSRGRLAVLCTLVAFMVNASFDVALEGPMAAMPFWIFVGCWLENTGMNRTVDSASA